MILLKKKIAVYDTEKEYLAGFRFFDFYIQKLILDLLISSH